MKGAVVIFLLLFFLVANSGISITIHWCGGKLASIEIWPGNGHPCSCGNKAMKPGCCKEDTFMLKASKEFSKTGYFSFRSTVSEFFIEAVQPAEAVFSVDLSYVLPDFYDPPPHKDKSPVYLLDRMFLI